MYDKLKKTAKENILFRFVLNAGFVTLGAFTRFFCLLFRVFPIKRNKVVCCNMKGKRYGDNPKYIVDKLLEKNKDLNIVWLMRDHKNHDVPSDISVKKYSYFSEIYHLCTAAVWVDSNTKPYGILKRKNQFFIQTWHGSYGLKKFGLEMGDQVTFYDRLMFKANAKNFDLVVSNSKKTTEIYQRSFNYYGKFLECGSPRNDLFFTDDSEIRRKVVSHFGIEGKKILLYAPTHRNSLSTECYNVDFERTITTLEKRFGGEWVILVRLHPVNMNASKDFINYSDKILNATDYDVMQELLVTADILLSDYSSCMFDFVTKRAPCFIYATDIDQYRNDRGYYFKLEDLPFPLAENNDELQNVIMDFDESKYEEDLSRLFSDVGLSESGEASNKVADLILDFIGASKN